uniref:Sterile alpha motif domain containing 14 n=1 Tax=Poecilia mexicana TaxID=48701 RepID=A0A3B3WDZ9_9TELE
MNPSPVADLNEAVPETELLDNSIQKGRAQLSVKTRRHRPSRSRYRDSVSSTEGDDGFDRKVESSLKLWSFALKKYEKESSSCFTLPSQGRRSPEEEGASLVAPPRGRYHQLTNATSQEALVTPSSSPSKSCPSSDCSPVYMRRNRRPDILVSDTSRDTSPADPSSPTVVFDKKTKRRFLDLGVTLRRSYIRVRKDKSNRLSVGSREPSESPSRSSGSFVSFSWFTEGRGSFSSSGTPPCSPKIPPLGSQRPRKSHSQASSDQGRPEPPWGPKQNLVLGPSSSANNVDWLLSAVRLLDHSHTCYKLIASLSVLFTLYTCII